MSARRGFSITENWKTWVDGISVEATAALFKVWLWAAILAVCGFVVVLGSYVPATSRYLGLRPHLVLFLILLDPLSDAASVWNYKRNKNRSQFFIIQLLGCMASLGWSVSLIVLSSEVGAFLSVSLMCFTLAFSFIFQSTLRYPYVAVCVIVVAAVGAFFAPTRFHLVMLLFATALCVSSSFISGWIASLKRHKEIENEQYEKRLLQSARFNATAELAAGVANEVAGPLATIEEALEKTAVVFQTFEKWTGEAEVVQRALCSAEKLKILCHCLQTSGKIEFTGQFEVLAVKRHLSDLVLLLTRILEKDHCRFNLQMNSRNDQVVTQAPGLFAQIIVNIVLNARDALQPKGGTITITTDDTACGISISVSDDGVGIAPEAIKHIFDPYFTTKSTNGDRGWGLTIAAAAARALGGAIDARSEQGSGTTLTITLPAREAPRSALRLSTRRPPSRASGRDGARPSDGSSEPSGLRPGRRRRRDPGRTR